MSKFLSSKEIETILLQHGFVFVSTRGSHEKFRKVGSPSRVVIVPANRKEIPFGTFRSIMRQSGLNMDDFIT